MAKERASMRFQADLSPKDAAILESLKSELDVRSNAELLAQALAIISWLVRERRSGHTVASIDRENRVRELVFPFVERAAVEYKPPSDQIDWTPQELASLAELASAEPREPTKELVAAMTGRGPILDSLRSGPELLARTEELAAKPHLSEQEQLEEVRLKKLKERAKGQMETLVAQAKILH